MNKLIPFQFESSLVRVVIVDGVPMLSARDVALVLGYTNPSKAYQDHCKSLKKLSYHELLEIGWDNPNPQGEYVINELDANRLKDRKDKTNETPISNELYVILFDNGVIKVGKSYNASFRVRRHKLEAHKYGVGISKHICIKNNNISERDLINFCKQNGNSHAGNEYFTGVSFTSIINFVSSYHLDIAA